MRGGVETQTGYGGYTVSYSDTASGSFLLRDELGEDAP